MGVSRSLRSAFVCLALALAVGCAKDPQLSKQEHLKRGDAYAREKKFQEAIVEYRSALQADPKYAEAFVGLGEAYIAIGDIKTALASYTRAADLLPENVDVQVKAGTMYLLRHAYVDAQTYAERALGRDPKNIVALILRANALAGLSQVDQAIKEIQDAIQLDPKRGDLYANLGSIQANQARYKEAEAAFQQAVAVDPTSPRAHSALGQFYWSIRRKDEAEAAFRKAVDLDPNDLLSNRILATFYLASSRAPEAERFLKAVADLSGEINDRLQQADFLALQGKFDEAIAIFKTVAEKQGGFGPATTRHAGAEYARGNKAEGHRLLDEVLKRNPLDAPALLLSARFLARESKPDEALAQAQQAVRADAGLIGAHFFLGQLYQGRGDAKSALLEYQTVVQLNPRATGAQLELSRLSLASGKPADAVAYADAARRMDSTHPDIRIALVRGLLEVGDLKRAEAELKSLEKDFRGSAEVASLIGNLYLRKRDIPAARRALEESYRRDPNDINTLSGLIATDLATNQPAAARARVDAAMVRAPKRMDVLMLAARTYAATGDAAKTEALLKQALTVDPSNVDCYGLLGQLYVQQGRLDDGRREFEAMAKRDPRNVGAQTMVGIILNKQGRSEDAIRQYEQLVTDRPEAAVAANNLAWIYVEQLRNLDRALTFATSARQALPTDPGIADTLGWTYYRKDLPMSGLPHLREAVQKEPQNPVYRYHLGATYAKAKDPKNAVIELEAALKISATFPGAEDARKLLASIKDKK
jgi:putative PEP-CTERM system TPR-repeat lipoprotein